MDYEEISSEFLCLPCKVESSRVHVFLLSHCVVEVELQHRRVNVLELEVFPLHLLIELDYYVADHTNFLDVSKPKVRRVNSDEIVFFLQLASSVRGTLVAL